MANNDVAGNGNGSKRIVTLDIETISTDPNDPKGALGNGVKDAAAPGERSQIILAGMLIDDGRELVAAPAIDKDERRVLQRFWSTVRPDDTIVGHNVREFDLARIKQRSWILGVEPSFDVSMAKYRENQVYDVMDMWTNWGRPDGASLGNIARALGVGEKTGHGSEVEELWRNGEFRRLLDYCMQDVYLAYLCFCRMKFRQPLPFNMPRSEPRREQDLEAQLRASVAHVEAERAPALQPLPLNLPQREPVPVYANRAGSQPDGRYRMVSDGHGGMQRLPIETPAAPGPKSVVGFAAAAPASEQGSKRSSRSKRVFYAVNGARMSLTGGTFAIKDALKALGARPTGEGAAFAWELLAEKFDQLAGLCARHGLQLVPGQQQAA